MPEINTIIGAVIKSPNLYSNNPFPKTAIKKNAKNIFITNRINNVRIGYLIIVFIAVIIHKVYRIK